MPELAAARLLGQVARQEFVRPELEERGWAGAVQCRQASGQEPAWIVARALASAPTPGRQLHQAAAPPQVRVVRS